MHVPTRRRLGLLPSFRGELETLRPRNLSVPQAGQAKRQARSPKGSERPTGALPRNRDLGELVIVNPHRIGSVRRRLCTWAASMDFFPFEARATARGPIQPGEVEPSSHRSPRGIVVPDVSSWLRSLLCASVRHPAPHAGPSWFNCCQASSAAPGLLH